MPDPSISRKLATILALDVAGYSARTEADESKTSAEVTLLRSVVERVATEHGGRVFNTAGDGFMLEFASSFAAVDAAQELAGRCEPKVRIGVHVGDVMVQPNGDLLGHGVNVAARLMARAEPGSALISGDVKRMIRGPLAGRLVSRGPMRLAKMAETIEAFAIGPPSAASGAQVMRAEVMLAVLPFDNASNDPETMSFSDGVAEEILEALKSHSGVRLVGRTPAERKGLAAQTLKPSHLLDGAVRRSGGRMRVTTQLTEAGTGNVLWNARYDRDTSDSLALQEEIARQVATILSQKQPSMLHEDVPKGTRSRSPAEEREILGLYATMLALRRCREQRGWYQQRELADAISKLSGRALNSKTVSAWETGANRPTRHMKWITKLFPSWEQHYAFYYDDLVKVARGAPLEASASEFLAYLKDSSRVVLDSASQSAGDKARAGVPSAVGDAVPGRMPQPWMITNHSIPYVRFDRVPRDQFAEVASVVERHYRVYIPRLKDIERVSAARAGNVYLITDTDPRNRPIVLKKYLRPRTNAQMRALERIQWRISRLNIFPHFSDFLTPLRTSPEGATRGGEDRTWVESIGQDSGPYTAFYFFEAIKTGEATHFRGDSEGELEDVALKLALLNNALASAPLATNPHLWFPLNPSRWDEVISRLETRSRCTDVPAVVLDHVALIRRAFADVAAMVEAREQGSERSHISLSNHHPHHVFTIGDICVLTCDHEAARNDWPEVANVGLAAHRFCREFIRQKQRGGSGDRSVVQDAANRAGLAFLRGYSKGRPGVVRDVIDNGTRWATAINLAKLVEHVGYESERKEDPSGCDSIQHVAEMTKFIAYLMELDQLKELDWLASSRAQLLA